MVHFLDLLPQGGVPKVLHLFKYKSQEEKKDVESGGPLGIEFSIGRL